LQSLQASRVELTDLAVRIASRFGKSSPFRHLAGIVALFRLDILPSTLYEFLTRRTLSASPLKLWKQKLNRQTHRRAPKLVAFLPANFK
jgi:hypothetical protein